MTQHQIEDLLNQQGDRLAGSPLGAAAESLAAEPTSVERAGLGSDDQRSLSQLMHLARRVQSVLVEVEPRPAFVVDLKARLVAQRRAELAPAGAARGWAVWVWGVAGALSLAGLGIVGYRVARAGRLARPALPKA